MNAPTSLGTFPSISVLQGLSSVNGRIIDNSSASRGPRGLRGARGPRGLSATDEGGGGYLPGTAGGYGAPSSQDVNAETVEL